MNRLLATTFLILTLATRAEDKASPQGDPALDPATLHCLGGYWIVSGDDNRNAKIEVEYRKDGVEEWKRGPNFFRVEKGAHKPDKFKPSVDVPDGAWLFAGSVFVLEPDTAYELRLKLADPDGGSVEKLLKTRTIAEPLAPKDMPAFHVQPGNGGGTGTEADPYNGLAAAMAAAKPGDLFLLHKGHYGAGIEWTKDGEPGKPIILRGAGDGEALIGGANKDAPAPKGISISGRHDVWLEKLSVANCNFCILAGDSARIVIRRCHIYNIHTRGIHFCGNASGKTSHFFISDNLVEGVSTWPRGKGIEDMNGIHGTGFGHVVCYNRIRGLADAVDTFNSDKVFSIDFHNNDCSELTDDGVEMDYSQRNTRCFNNRFTNVYQGISTQPVYGGPVYIFRNAMYNVCVEPFKMHNSPSGALMIHNTVVKKGEPLILQTPEKVRNCYFRNNLFIGSSGRAYHCDPEMIGCDYDYDGFGGFSGPIFMKWNKVMYATPDEMKQKAPIYKHVVVVDPATAFASGIGAPADEKKQFEPAVNELRLKEGTQAIDSGEKLPGFNDGFAGKAPDLGAYEFGAPLPHYGPRPEK